VASIFVNIEKGIEIAAEDALKFITGGASKVESAGPDVVAGLGVLAGAVEKALSDVASGASNPAQLVLALPADISDLKAVWPAIVTFLGTLGVKV
jgi:hypothetical protein